MNIKIDEKYMDKYINEEYLKHIQKTKDEMLIKEMIKNITDGLLDCILTKAEAMHEYNTLPMNIKLSIILDICDRELKPYCIGLLENYEERMKVILHSNVYKLIN